MKEWNGLTALCAGLLLFNVAFAETTATPKAVMGHMCVRHYECATGCCHKNFCRPRSWCGFKLMSENETQSEEALQSPTSSSLLWYCLWGGLATALVVLVIVLWYYLRTRSAVLSVLSEPIGSKLDESLKDPAPQEIASIKPI